MTPLTSGQRNVINPTHHRSAVSLNRPPLVNGVIDTVDHKKSYSKVEYLGE
jgi:hypothetical protein